MGDSSQAKNESVSNYKHYDGNQPSTTIMLDVLTPETFGGLIAMYEHKVFVQSVIWGVNPFDQWGVEQGKQMATNLLKELCNSGNDNLDASTNGIIRFVQDQNKGASK